MENFFKKALKLKIENGLETLLSVAVAHNVLAVNIQQQEKKPFSQKKQARLFNAFFKYGYEKIEYKFLGQKLFKEILKTFSDENGFKAPDFNLKNIRVTNQTLAEADGKNIVNFCKNKHSLKDKFNKENFANNCEIFPHESEHLKQMFYIKEYLKGKDVETKYKIMAFQQIYKFCDIKTQIFDFTNKDYWFNSMEIEARKAGIEFIFKLLKNPELDKDAKNELFLFSQTELESVATLRNSGKKLLKQLSLQTKQFEKMFKDTELGLVLLDEYRKIETEIKDYAKSLDDYGNNILPRKIKETRYNISELHFKL